MLTVSYDFYLNEFHGTLSEEEFARQSVFAAAYLEELTLGRAADGLPEDKLYKARLAFCAVVDVRSREERREGIASESNDGISVSYAEPNVRGAGSRLRAAAALYLGPAGLLYRGVG